MLLRTGGFLRRVSVTLNVAAVRRCRRRMTDDRRAGHYRDRGTQSVGLGCSVRPPLPPTPAAPAIDCEAAPLCAPAAAALIPGGRICGRRGDSSSSRAGLRRHVSARRASTPSAPIDRWTPVGRARQGRRVSSPSGASEETCCSEFEPPVLPKPALRLHGLSSRRRLSGGREITNEIGGRLTCRRASSNETGLCQSRRNAAVI